MKSTVHNLHSFNREGINKMTKRIWNNRRGKIDYAVLLTTQQKGISKQQAFSTKHSKPMELLFHKLSLIYRNQQDLKRT